jgi:hypothetical protein
MFFLITDSFPGRFPLSFQVVPALILAVGIFFLPESPRWLLEKDRDDEARQTLRKLHYDGKNEEFLRLEFMEIQDAIQQDRINQSRSWISIFSKPSWRRRLMLGCGVQAFGQLSGINGLTSIKYLGESQLIANVASDQLLWSSNLPKPKYNHI